MGLSAWPLEEPVSPCGIAKGDLKGIVSQSSAEPLSLKSLFAAMR